MALSAALLFVNPAEFKASSVSPVEANRRQGVKSSKQTHMSQQAFHPLLLTKTEQNYSEFPNDEQNNLCVF